MLRLDLGKFPIKSGKIDITDPCYESWVWCRETKTDILNGEYNATAIVYDEGVWGKRIGELEIEHDSYKNKSLVWKNEGIVVGVDAGVCGFFDGKPNYTDDEWQDICEWFKHESDNFERPNMSVVDPSTPFKCYGVVTSSGYGDGSYECFVKRESNGYIVGLKLVYINKVYEAYEDYKQKWCKDHGYIYGTFNEEEGVNGECYASFDEWYECEYDGED